MNAKKIWRGLKNLKNPRLKQAYFRRLRALFYTKKREVFNPHPKVLKMAGITFGEKLPIFIIAEVGINHNGKLEEALDLIDEAAKAGANAVKFQKRSLKDSYIAEVVEKPEMYDQSFQYLIPILKETEFDSAEYKKIKAHCDKLGIILFATPFDEESVNFLEETIDPALYKVSSADLVNLPLLEKLITTKKPLILSTGMSTLDEIAEAVGFLNKHNAIFALLHCQSTYPAAPETLNLAIIKQLRSRFGVPVGYSGHETGIDHTLTAAALGATIIERHITFDQKALGPDHAASLTPAEFSEMVKRIREMEKTLGLGVRQLTRGEIMNRLPLRKSLVAAIDIKKGEKIERAMIRAKSPGTALSPLRLYDIVGRRSRRSIQKDSFIREDDIVLSSGEFTIPDFKTRWGLKARFFEVAEIEKFLPRPAFLEFHMSDKDLEFQFPKDSKFPYDLYIHAPEYNGKLPVDLASDNDETRERSIEIIQRSIDKTREIAKHFKGTPKIIIHVGGMSIEPDHHRQKLLERAISAFKRLDWKGVDVMPENLPAVGWFFSGLWHINFFGRAEDMIEFCNRLKLSMCLDLSHAWLYCQASGDDYLEFLKKVAPFTAHLHIADGRGAHKEGLQIGEGDVPFKEAFDILDEGYKKSGRQLSWVPEIWQGHLNGYREFKIALSRLGKFPFLRGK